MDVAEIAARFGDSPLSTTELVTGTFRIGTAAGVDLPLQISGLTTFPLVEWTQGARRSCVARIPLGIAAHHNGIAVDGTVTLLRGDRFELRIGQVEIAIAVVPRATPLARPRIDPRFASWIAAALVVHLAFLGIVDTLARPESQSIPLASALPTPPPLPEPQVDDRAGRVRSARRRELEKRQTTPQPRTIAQPERVVAMESAPEPEAPRDRAISGARRAGFLGLNMVESIKAIAGTVDIAKALSDVGPIYREDEENEKRGQFGTGRHFVPAPSVPTGRYATVSGGRAVGDQYALPGEVGAKEPPKVKTCTGECTMTGGNDRNAVETAVGRYSQAILGCYERKGGNKRGDVVIEFEIGDDGKVIHAEGAGLGDTGSCVAGVMRRVRFPTAPATTVRFPMTFEP